MNRPEAGSITLEFVLLAPVLVLLVVFMSALGRVSGARLDVDEVAWKAARAAAHARSAPEAEAEARRVVEPLVAEGGACGPPLVLVDLSRFAPGGSVGVEVSCAVDSLLGPLAGARQVRSRAVASLEPYRSLR